MPYHPPPENERCEHVFKDGKRCRQFRRKEMGSLYCGQHGRPLGSGMSRAEAARLAREILPPGIGLGTAEEVNAALTRVFRLVAEQQLPPRYATALGYLGQLILMAQARMEQEAAAQEPPAYPLGAPPEAIVSELAELLRSALQEPGAGEAAGPRLPEPGVVEERNG